MGAFMCISSITVLKREMGDAAESQPLRPMRSTEGQCEAGPSQRSQEGGRFCRKILVEMAFMWVFKKIASELRGPRSVRGPLRT